jgi:hypothetical protein
MLAITIPTTALSAVALYAMPVKLLKSEKDGCANVAKALPPNWLMVLNKPVVPVVSGCAYIIAFGYINIVVVVLPTN